MYHKIMELALKPDGIGGLTMGADPIAIATAFVSYMMGNPIQAFSIRKEPKGHGLMLQIEGNVLEGNKVIITDDVVTTGESTIKAINIARDHGLKVIAAIILLDRCEENGRENIERLGVRAHPVLTLADFV